MTSVLKSISVTVSFETEQAAYSSHVDITETANEFENIREIQGKINEVVTERIDLLKAENKLLELVNLEEADDEHSSSEE